MPRGVPSKPLKINAVANAKAELNGDPISDIVESAPKAEVLDFSEELISLNRNLLVWRDDQIRRDGIIQAIEHLLTVNDVLTVKA